jgi:uncharacterized membrane protein
LARESAYFKEIERLLGIGYEAKHIMKISGIPQTTVYRIVDKLKKEARYDFKNLMEHDYLYKYQMNIENFSKTIQESNEEIEKINKKYNTLELMTMDELNSCPMDKVIARATLLSNLTNIQSNRTNELQKMINQRDKATELKAKVYNQGPVVYAVNEWINSKPPPMGEQPRLKELDKVLNVITEPLKLNTITPETDSDDELNTQMEMESDEEK